MADVSVLEVLLHGVPIGTLTRLSDDRTIFAFNEAYIEDRNRAVLGLSFKDDMGELITKFRSHQTRVMPFFSNLLPEGHMREYLAERAGVKAEREFFLLWVLGQDLPGAVSVKPADGDQWPTDASDQTDEDADDYADKALRFSLAGVQMKFSAIAEASGGLTMPAKGVGGHWIVKLPSLKFSDVPENEFSMMELARNMGMDVPEVKLVNIDSIGNLPEGIGDMQGAALAIKRFDRTSEGEAVHIEDFAQVFDIYPTEKYEKASFSNIASVLAAEGKDEDVIELIRRLTFNTLIGNADMHLKNWSIIYPDGKHAALAPAYDFVSTIAYIEDSKAALNFSRSKRFDSFSIDELSRLANRAKVPEAMVLDTARETVARFEQAWEIEKRNLPLSRKTVLAIEAHVKSIPFANTR